MVDGGCGPYHVLDSSFATGRTAPSKHDIAGVGGILLTNNKVGKAGLRTMNAQGANRTLQLPGNALFPHGKMRVSLVSHSTLLKHGWKIDLRYEGGTAISPKGELFNLEKKGSSWFFPNPMETETNPRSTMVASQAQGCSKPSSTTVRAPSAKENVNGTTSSPKRGSSNINSLFSNRFSCLESESMAEEAAQGQVQESPGVSPSVSFSPDVNLDKSPRDTSSSSAKTKSAKTDNPKPANNDSKRTETVSKEDFMNPRFDFSSPVFAALVCSAALGKTDYGISEELRINLDKWDELHRSYNHPSDKRMRKLAAAMLPDDPNRPALSTLSKWVELRKCGSCLLGKSKKPPQDREHPRVPHNDSFKPGEFLNVDGFGAYSDPSVSGLGWEATIDGTTTSFIITDYSSNAITAVPVTEKTTENLLLVLQEYEAKSGIKIKKVRTDGEFCNKTSQDWARKREVDFDGSAPRTQQQNGRSEGSVRILKDGYRTARNLACTSDHTISKGIESVAQQHNRTPSTRDPAGKNRSPLQQFPTLPFENKSLKTAPFGCRCFPHIGKIPGQKSSEVRAHAAIYLCHDKYLGGHQVLNLDTNTIETHAYVHVEPHRFPLRELHLAGEVPIRDFDSDLWRKYAPFAPAAVDDRALGEFCSGKQLRLRLPKEQYYKEYDDDWVVRAHKLQGPVNGEYALKCVYEDFLGDKSKLNAKDRKLLDKKTTLWIDIPISPMAVSRGAKVWDKTNDLRSLLKLNYPTATTLSDFASLSALIDGKYPDHPLSAGPDDDGTPDPSADPVPDQSPDTGVDGQDGGAADDEALKHGVSSNSEDHSGPAAPQLRKRPFTMILPSRVVGKTRSSKGKWTSPDSSMIPDRQLRTRVPTSGQRAKAKAFMSRIVPGQGIVLTPADDGRVGFEPRNLKEAERHKSWPLWKGAMLKEENGLRDRGTFTRCTKEDVPEGVKIMGSQFVFKDKRVTGAKARIVVRGDQQYPKPDSADTYAATPSATEVRTLIALAVQNNYAIHSCDISQAFVQADALPDDADLYIYPPRGSTEPPGTVWKLNRPLYGLAVAPRAWSDTLRRFLKEYGFTSVNNSDTCYTWSDPSRQHHMHLVYHVDDIMLAFSDDKHGTDFKRALLTRFSGSDEGPLRRYLGIDITRDGKQLHMSQEAYAREVLERFGMQDCNPVATPMEAGYMITKTECPEHPDEARRLKYQEITGSLQFLVQWTRPDLAFATNELAKVNSNPAAEHLAVAMRVLRYLKGTAHLGLTYTRDLDNPNQLIGWADADFAACTDTRRSISAYILMMNGGAVSWKSRQQKSVSTSTSQAEFVSASWAADEILWLRRTLSELHAPQAQATPLFEDNRACRMMSENPVHRERSKHIDYRVHALRERVADGVVRLLDCPTVDMVADMGTKSLPGPAHCKHRDTAMGLTRHTSPQIPTDLGKRGGGQLGQIASTVLGG